jgi:predicted RNA methylase
MTPTTFEIASRAGITRTFEDPDETAFYAGLVRLAVTSTRAQRVLDVGCGAGIATLEAARAGAREVVGIDVEQTSVEIARGNIRCAGQNARASAHVASWQDVCSGRFPASPDLLVSNPPYVPGGRGRSVDGGFFGTGLLDDIIDHVPEDARAVALLFGSITDPITFLSRVAARGFEVAHLIGYSVPFGRYTSSPSTLRHLRILREQGRAFFRDVPAASGSARHAYLTLGLIAYRSPEAAARAQAMLNATRAGLVAYQESSVNNPSSAPKRAAS